MSLISYYRDPADHILTAKEKRSGDLYCKTCNRLYNMHRDLEPLIKFRKKLTPLYSDEGQAIKRHIRKMQLRRINAKISWHVANPDYFKGYYQEKKADLIQKAVERQQKAKQQDPEGYRLRISAYGRRRNAKPEVKKKRLEKQRILRGLAMLGLGNDYSKQYRIRKKMKRNNLTQTADPLAPVILIR